MCWQAERLDVWADQSVSAILFFFFFPPIFTHLCFRSCGWAEAVWYVAGGGGVSSSRCHYRREKQKTHMYTDSCKHKHIPLTVSFCCAQTHLPNPALSAALFQRASGFKNKWRAWPFIMFRTLFFLRLECGQECVVALLTLRGRKTYHVIMLEEKEERKTERTGWSRDLMRSKGGGRYKKRKVAQAKSTCRKTTHYC